MPETRNDELYRALKHNGYPDDFCREIAYRQMNTDFTATRMLGYLYRVTSPRAEDVVDEMLAILSDRKAWIEKNSLRKPRRQSAECIGKACNLGGRLCRKAEGTGLHSFPVSATISAVKKRRKETVATERIQRESGR